jgi:GGDEF domain-containing protein
MTNLRRSIMFLLIHLIFVFNIERIDVSGEDIFDLQSFVYVLITVVVLTILINRTLQRFSVYINVFLWCFVYLILKLLVFYEHPMLGGAYTYLTIAEVSVLCVTVFLTYNVARELTGFEEIIEKVTFPKLGHQIKGFKEAVEDIRTEFIRSRRHNRPLSVMLVDLDSKTTKDHLEKAILSIQKSMVKRYLLASLAKILVKEARRTDIIIEQEEKDSFILLCPETTAEGSTILADRVKNLATDRLGVLVECGVASFPEEALTFEDLIKKASNNKDKLETLDVPVNSVAKDLSGDPDKSE